jgi:hypothetical protein
MRLINIKNPQLITAKERSFGQWEEKVTLDFAPQKMDLRGGESDLPFTFYPSLLLFPPFLIFSFCL